ncbi:glycoside hydrolase [Tricharina praecox]|uniref:glycoside hydrolase n=1 Tax=Tricharina praecox TaxID=43433 RepID=UPI00221EBA83|nr:glycoside hydrolase [Tricharina praecox]KAI5857878.1 glycoside hydrolase [Tricharina praecox]
MSFSLPKNVPSFTAGQRDLENQAWSTRFGRQQKDLPLYKDKPYYSNSATVKQRRMVRKKRFIVFIVALVFGAYWFGVFSRDGVKPPVIGGKPPLQSAADWDARREKVKAVFVESWISYERDAWGSDIYAPISRSGRQMGNQGLGWIIVDSLDTLMIMNLTTELSHARSWVEHTLNYDQNTDVNTFETTIRMLGGLLSAHYLQEVLHLVPSDKNTDMYLEKAAGLADRLMGAFDSPSGIPYASVNLHSSQGIQSHTDGGASSTAEATTLQLEMKYLAKLTGEAMYWEKAEKEGLVPIFINAVTGKFHGSEIRMGSRGDSYYEYLIKQYLQTKKTEDIFKDMYNEAMAGMKKHLLGKSHPSHLTYIAELPSGIGGATSPKMDHLVCFVPGMLALGATMGRPVERARKASGGKTWGAREEEDLTLARELMHTCYQMYAVTETGLAPEIAWFNADPPAAGIEEVVDYKQDIIIKQRDAHNLQRPETVESLFVMWRLTGDEMYREWGWKIFESFVAHTKVLGGGYTSLDDVRKVPAPARDNMESFWLAETLKYLYLLFSPEDLLPLDEVVFNTEAHPLPMFDMPSHFKKANWRKETTGAADPAAAAAAAAPVVPPPAAKPAA